MVSSRAMDRTTGIDPLARADPLDGLFEEARTGERAPIKKLNYTHEALVDLLITHPELNQNQLAARFGYTAAWLSTIICSDAFQAQLAKRREEVIDPVLRLSVEERFKALVNRSFEVLMEKMQGPAQLVNDQVALRAAEMGAKVIAIRAAQNSGAPPMPPGERLTKLAGRLRELQKAPPDVVDVEPKEAQA